MVGGGITQGGKAAQRMRGKTRDASVASETDLYRKDAWSYLSRCGLIAMLPCSLDCLRCHLSRLIPTALSRARL
eukprot:5014681-Prorocentrum_lima.AAC.1